MTMVDCLSRIPYASLIGFILVFVGGSVMAGTLFDAVQRTDEFFRQEFVPVEQLIYVRIGAIFVAATAILLAFFILVFAILATEATRGKIYRGDRCILGGKCTASFFLALTYIAALAWLTICSLLVIPSIAWVVHEKICYEELRHQDPSREINGPTLYNITRYGVYFKPYLYEKSLNYREAITQYSAFTAFCSKVRTVGPFYVCALIGSICVMLGMVAFIGSLSSTYMRLKYTRELTEFRSAIDAQQHAELDYIISPKRM